MRWMYNPIKYLFFGDIYGENTISFIGAGPGDPELITVKGKRLIREADVIIYAGSLVNPAVLDGHKEDAVVYNSAEMHLEEVVEVMRKAEAEGRKCVRVHTGDPAIYGAHREQMDLLDGLGIEYEVVPGVSSAFGAAAALKKEYTLPGDKQSQTVIFTRMEGRTPVPGRESIRELAKHRATMVIFLSTGFLDDLCRELVEGGYPRDTPAAVVYKATWPDQRIVEGDLTDIASKVRGAGITKTALILVGNFLGDDYERSKLYDRYFTTEFRKGEPQ